MGLEAFKRHTSGFVNEMRYAYQDSKKYLDKGDKAILGLAIGAISVFTLGILTKPAYTYLVGRLKDKSETFQAHQLAVADKINRKAFNQESADSVIVDRNTMTITNADCSDDQLKELLKNNLNITNLTLLGCTKITNKALENLPESLTSLSLIGCDRITDKGIQHLEKLGNLQTLELAGCNSITDQALETIGKLRELKHLDLGGCFNLTNKGMKNLKSLKLEFLDISDCKKIDENGIRELNNKSMKTLDLKRTAVSETKWIISFKELQSLYLEGSFENIALEDAEKLENLEIRNASAIKPKTKPQAFDLSFEFKVSCPNSLKQLRIINSPEVMEGITNKSLSFVEVLDLSNNDQIPQNFLEKIRKENLKELSLSNFSDQNALSIINGCSSLEKLKLSGVKMNTLDLSSFSALKEVDLSDTNLKKENVTLKQENPPTMYFKEEQPPPPEIKKEVIEEKKLKSKENEIEKEKEVIVPKIFKKTDVNAKTIQLPAEFTEKDLEYLIQFKNLEGLDLSLCAKIPSSFLKSLFEKVKNIETLRSLNLSGLTLQDSDWDTLSEFKQLTSLILDKSNISADNGYTLTLLKSLEKLSLKGVQNLSEKILEELSSLSNLQELDLSETNLQKEWLPNIKNLDIIKYENTGVKWEDIENQKNPLKSEKKAPKIDNYPLGFSLENNVLTLQSTVNDQDLSLLRFIPGLETVHSVVLKNNINVTDSGLSNLKHLKNLKNLTLNGCTKFNGTFFLDITQLPLESCDFSDCTCLDDPAMSMLANKESPIKTLILKNTPISAAYLFIENFPKLERLDLKGSKIQLERIQEIKNVHPNTEITPP